MASSYRDVEIYKASFDLFVRTHTFSLKLPKYELYELGSQLRRSSDSVNSNIVEGYGKKIISSSMSKKIGVLSPTLQPATFTTYTLNNQ